MGTLTIALPSDLSTDLVLLVEPLVALALPPVADAAAGSWTTHSGATTGLYATLDEQPTADDADYIRSPLAPSGQTYRATIQAGADPGVDTGHVVRYRYRKDAAGGATVSLTVSLYSAGTLIAQQTHSDLPAAWTDGSFTLTEVEAAAITDYGALEVRMSATQA